MFWPKTFGFRHVRIKITFAPIRLAQILCHKKSLWHIICVDMLLTVSNTVGPTDNLNSEKSRSDIWEGQNQYSYFVLRIKLTFNFPYINAYVMSFLCQYVILIRLKSTRQFRLSLNYVFISLVFVTTSPLKGLPSQFRNKL